MTLRLSMLVLVAALAACDSAPPENAATAAAGNEAAAPRPAAAAPAGTTAEPDGAADVNFDGEGVRLVDPSTGSARPLPFGTPEPAAMSALGAAFGAPPVDQSVNAECGAGPILHARWANGFVALFQEDRFQGWDMRLPGLTTADGIGIGSTRVELEASREVEVEATTLGTEFSAGGLGGLFASPEPAAEIVSLWAGLTCQFR